ncbi:MAG: rod shape-determining protein RodA [Alphaproteobacteria bacterium]|nr:rod shape-determining protein RodA [Alphaproteobacteria bacterium]
MSRLSAASPLSLGDKLRLLNWGLVAIILILGLTGIGLLYSAGGKSWDPWAGPQSVRFATGFAVMMVIALVDIRFWLKIAYPLYFIMLVLLVVVEVRGHIGMGAQRWINLGFFVLQPSELMKIALVLALSKYFHALEIEDVGRPMLLIPPALMVLAPVGLVLLQPNLGTATLLSLASAGIFYVAGVRWWKFAIVILLAGLVLPFAWEHLHDYQKARLMTFVEPEADPQGAGYNIMQSKIALGSGGLFGKGFGQGTQSQLQFLPEKHTDFIFVVLAEEFGLIGAIALLFFYFLLLVYGYMIALTSRSQFARLAAFGLTTSFFLYVFVNVAMVTGTIPVVGIPLPLVSYGGTAMLTLLIGCGLLLGLSIHRDVRISRTGSTEF